MKTYYRLMLGAKSVHAEECYKGNFIGVDFGIHEDLTGRFHDTWRDFNKEFIPIYLSNHPDKKKVAAGLACATIWVVSNYLKIGDIVLCPNGSGSYMVGEISGNYTYNNGQILPHRRAVKWYPNLIERASMSDALRNSTGAIATYCDITKHAEEIEILIGSNRPPTLVSTDSTVEDPSEFALEKHLEEFLVQNWNKSELGKHYDIYEEDGELVGQQYPSDTGPIDILAISKDKKTLLVVELKKGRVSDNVVGQIQRYMGYVKEELAETNQKVKGVIIALEDDLRIKRALSVTDNIEFYRYQVSFKLFKN
jgi:restriction system protein